VEDFPGTYFLLNLEFIPLPLPHSRVS
jgi:hypothetical protein